MLNSIARNHFIGKTNQFNNREYASCIRARHVEVCPVGALAIYFFYRFVFVPGSSLPNYENRSNWFNIKVALAYLCP
jgi:hypothetical protein